MVALAEWITPNFSVDGFWDYVGARLHHLARQLGLPLADRQPGSTARRKTTVSRAESRNGGPRRPESLLGGPLASVIVARCAVPY